MYIFFTDESKVFGKEGRDYGLSIYGGLILEKKQIQELTDFIYEIKERYLYPQVLELKWSFRDVWNKMQKVGFIAKNITSENKPELYKSIQDDYVKLKNSVLDKIAESDVKIVIAVRPNKLLNASEEKDIEYSIGAVTKKFRKILVDHNKIGIILADELRPRLSDGDIVNYQYILNLCSANRGNLDNCRLPLIVPTIDSCVSPIHQMNDIMLGSIQYYMLEFIKKLNNGNFDMFKSKGMVGKIVDKFYKSRNGGYIINNGLLLYPPKISRRKTGAGLFLDKLEQQLKIDFNIN